MASGEVSVSVRHKETPRGTADPMQAPGPNNLTIHVPPYSAVDSVTPLQLAAASATHGTFGSSAILSALTTNF